ncbi:hypothetical protein CERSUDRAFT_105290 [Gelatoporia subvermispora B]|uniref:Calcium activated cation channel n=1 Tax=Ceriporiopsis subvermispora (strain B) TaxID=914234 RepID=M2RFL4_CERS8|nr:hypothetical protein CERSUDRAFT_105290 [Gelatoporia subvermispora B]
MSESTQHEELTALTKAYRPTPETISNLVKRVRALTFKLLPVEVHAECINDPTSRVITPAVVSAYTVAAGDFIEALPYCLMHSRMEFLRDADDNPADFEENSSRAAACAMLARRIIHNAPPERITSMMCTRFQRRNTDGHISKKTSALEAAIDSHCTIFLSSSEAQAVVADLWNGHLIQKHTADREVEFVLYKERGYDGFLSHLNPSRLLVPRYQNILRTIAWLIFLLAYSLAVKEPLDKLDPYHAKLDVWELLMYGLALSFSFHDLSKIYQLARFSSWHSLGFWNVVSLVTDSLLLAAFILRMTGIASPPPQDYVLRTRAFQCLSFVAPLICFVGTMQICVSRMLQESGIFFGLLAILGLGFTQGLYALDVADGQEDHQNEVVHLLVQALLQAPDYTMFADSPSGQILFYMWNVATAIIILNILISLFASAYDDIAEDASAEYLTYFASKVVGMIRAPDEFTYPAPVNLIETLFIAPLEYVVSECTYTKINRYVMLTLFFVPLSIIALYEAELDPSKNKWVKDWLSHPDEVEEDDPRAQDPEAQGADAERGMQISKVPFDELVKDFPDTTQSSEAVLLREMADLKAQLAELKAMLAER